MFSLTGIAHRYGDTTVLRVDEWRAEAGEHWLVAGASGSGKTTLLHILAALTTPTTGTIIVGGTDLGGLSGAARDRWRGRSVGLVPQRLHLVGALAPTGHAIDRLVLTGIESVWSVHEPAGQPQGRIPERAARRYSSEPAGADADRARDADTEQAKSTPALTPPGPAPAREVTLALVKYASPVAAASLPRVINAETVLQAASPACESARLLALSGLLIGLGIAHALAATIEAWLPAAGELSRGARVWQSAEWGIVALALGAGIIATVIPAWRAYRQDVAATLAEG